MLAADIVVAVEDATLGLPEVKRGLIAGGQRSPATVGDTAEDRVIEPF